MTEETDDAFLGGRLKVLQPRRGYRAGTDAVLVASAVPAAPGEEVLELGCGTGVVLLCLAARIPGVRLTGAERRADYAALARRNCARNGVVAEIVETDVHELPPALRARSFDHVVANPPYLDRRRGKAGVDARREGAIAGEMGFSVWADVGMRRLRPGGRLTMIAPTERLPELLRTLGGIGVTVIPLAARMRRDAERFVLSAIKGGRAPFQLRAPFVIHEGATHTTDDGDDFAPGMRAILRDAAALNTTKR